MSFLGPIQSIALAMIAGSWLAIVAGRRQKTASPQPGARTAAATISLGTQIAAGSFDVAAAIRDVLTELLPEAAGRRACVEMAVQPNLDVRVDRQRFADTLALLVRRALAQASCRRVLVGAMRRGGQMRITVTDDGHRRDLSGRQELLRELGAILTPLDGTVYVAARPGQGTTVAIHLPAPPALRDERRGSPVHAGSTLQPGRP